MWTGIFTGLILVFILGIIFLVKAMNNVTHVPVKKNKSDEH